MSGANAENEDRGKSSTGTIVVIVGALLLVGFCAFGVIVGPMMMALQSARTQARNSTCINNLRQLGIATVNFHDMQGGFPMGWSFDEETPDQPQWSWQARLLQNLERERLFEALNRLEDPLFPTLDEGSPEIAELLAEGIQVLACPSDDFRQFDGASHPDRRYLDPAGNPVPLGLSMYVGNTGHLHDASGARRNTGIFFGNSAISIHDVTDGLSNTILLGERDLTRCRAGSWPGVPNPGTHDGGVSIWNVVAGAKPSPNAEPWDGDTKCGEGFSSGHPGTVNVLLCDGSVRTINNTIDSHWHLDPADEIGIFQRLMIRNDGLDVPLNVVQEVEQ